MTNQPQMSWYSIQTPSVFREYRLADDPTDRTATQRRQFAELENLAEIHRTSILQTNYRRG